MEVGRWLSPRVPQTGAGIVFQNYAYFFANISTKADLWKLELNTSLFFQRPNLQRE